MIAIESASVVPLPGSPQHFYCILAVRKTLTAKNAANEKGTATAKLNAANAPMSLLLMGSAAEIVFHALDAIPEGKFGLVQTSTKRVPGIECVQAIMGDVPGRMSEPHHSCVLTINKK